MKKWARFSNMVLNKTKEFFAKIQKNRDEENEKNFGTDFSWISKNNNPDEEKNFKKIVN